MIEYSFCESVHAGPCSPWHIRELTKKGRKLGGGVDTPFLCQHPDVTLGWDLEVDINDFHLKKNTCPKCAAHYLKKIHKNVGRSPS